MKFRNLLVVILVFLWAIYLDIPKIVWENIYDYKKSTVCKKILQSAEGEDFDVILGEHSNLYYTDKDKEYKNMVLRIADTYYPLIAEDFKYEGNKKVNIIIYSDSGALSKALNMQDKREAPPIGAYYGGVLNILSPKLWINEDNEAKLKDVFLEDGPIIHEMVHFILDERLSGKYPLWFTEGMALYYENKYTGFVWHEDLKNASKHITVEQLEEEFSCLNEGEAYRRSYDIINNIADKYGEHALLKIIDNMEYGYSFKEAAKVSGISLMYM